MTQKLRFIISFILVSQVSVAVAADSPSISPCDVFFEKTERLEGGLSRREVFSSGALALQEMRLGLEYPVYPPEREDILRKILAFKSVDGQSAIAIEPQMVSIGEVDACESGKPFAWFTRLIRSAEAFHFDSEQKHELESLVLTHLRNDTTGPRPLFQQQMNLKLIQFAKEHSLLTLSSKEDRLLNTVLSRIDVPDGEQMRRDSKIERKVSEVVIPPDSHLEKHRENRLIQLERDDLQESERLRSVLSEVLGL